MATREVIRDFVISIGLESKDAEKALNALEKKIKGVGARTANIKNRQQSNELRNQQKLEQRRRAFELKILKARDRVQTNLKDQGVDPSVARKFDNRLNSIRGNLAQIKNIGAFQALSTRLNTVNFEVQKAARSQKKYNRELKRGNRLAKSFTLSLKNMVRSYASIFALLAGAGAINRTIQQFESLRASMLAASGTTQQAEKDFEFIKGTARELKADITALAKGYQQIGTAARAAGFSTEETRNIFLSAAEASRAFGLSADDTSGVMRAFAQILSKGNVQAEELRGQLGDRLFGAFQQAALAMGMTTNELDKMLKQGKLASKDFLSKFPDQLRKVVRETGALGASLKTSQAAQQSFFTEMKLGLDELGTTGLSAGLIEFWEGLAALVRSLTPLFVAFGRVIGFILTIVGQFLKTIEPILTIISSIFDVLTSPLEPVLNKTNPLNAVQGIGRRLTAQQRLSSGSASSISGDTNNVVEISIDTVTGDPKEFRKIAEEEIVPIMLRQNFRAES